MSGAEHGRGPDRASRTKGLVALCGLGRRYHDLWWRRQVRHHSPWTAWNREHGAVFVHVPKNAGTSMYATFGMEAPAHTHCPVTGYLASDRGAYLRAFSFAFVRDPFARAVSAFRYLKRQPIGEDDERWAEQHLGPFDDFESFAEALERPLFAAQVLSWRHFMPQWYFLADARGRERVGFIGRVETLGADVARIGERLALAPHLRHVNATGAKPVAPDAVDPRVRATIARLYAEDYRRYGYSPASAV